MFNFKYTGRKEPRFTSLNSESLRFLQQFKAIWAQVPEYCCAGFSETQDLKERVNALKRRETVENATLKILVRDTRRHVKSAPRYAAWRAHQDSFMKSNTWQAMSRAVPLENWPKLETLREQFMATRQYAHCSSAALHYLAFDMLPQLNAYHEFLQEEWRAYQHDLDVATKKDLHRFIQELSAWLNLTRQQLAQAMTVKLITASNAHDPTYDDHLYELLTSLKQCKALKDTMTLWEPSYGLTPPLTGDFLQYIAASGCKQAVSHVKHQVGWLTAHPQYVTHINIDNIYTIPKAVQHVMPRSALRRWWQRVVHGFDAVEDCLRHQALIAAMRLLENQSVKPPAHTQFSDIALRLQTLSDQVHTVLQDLEASTPKSFWARWWQSNSVLRQRKGFVRYWQQQLRLVASYSLTTLTQVMQQWEAQSRHDSSLVFNDSVAEQVQYLQKALQRCCTHIRLSALQEMALNSLTTRFERLFDKYYSSKALIENLLQGLAQAPLTEEGGLEAFGQGRLQPLFDHAENLKLVDPKKFQALQQQARAACANVTRLLQHDLQQFQRSHVALSHARLSNMCRAVKVLKCLGDVKSLEGVVRAFFQDYVTRGLTVERHDMNAWWDDAESLLLTLAQQVQLTALTDAVIQLKRLRQAPELTEFRSRCQHIVNTDRLTQLREQASSLSTRYSALLSRLLAQHFTTPAVYQRIMALIQKAVIEHLPNSTALPLSASECSLLQTSNPPIRYWVDQLIWLKSQPDVEQQSETTLQTFVVMCERRLATTLTQVIQKPKGTPITESFSRAVRDHLLLTT